MSRRTQWGVFVLQCLLDCKFANIKFGVRKDKRATTAEMGEGKGMHR